MSFVDVLPVEPVIATTRAPPASSRRQAAASACRPASGSAWAITHPARARRRAAGSPAPRRAAAPARARGREHAARRRLAARRRRTAPPRLAAASPTYRTPGLDGRELCSTRAAAAAGDRCRPPLRRPLMPGPRPRRRAARALRVRERFARPPARRRRAPCAPPANSCPCSCPLPAITTRSPCRAPATAAVIAVSAVGASHAPPASPAAARRDRTVHDLGDDLSRVLRARVVGGDEHHVGEARGDLAHQRALAAIAVAAGSRTRRRGGRPLAAGDQLARAREHVLERVGRVGVVDQHAEVLAPLDRLEAPRARAPRARGRRDRSRSKPNACTAARARPARSRR